MRALEVKVCGVRSPSEVVELQAAASADPAAAPQFVGVHLLPESRRCVEPAMAARIIGACRELVPVAVVRGVAEIELARTCAALGVHWLQLHGDEPLADVAGLARHFHIIKRVDAAQLDNAPLMQAYAAAGVRRLLLDLRALGPDGRPRLPATHSSEGRVAGIRLWITGGLHDGNVAAVAAGLGAAGVDSATGVELFGRFSVERAVAFARAARAVASPLAGEREIDVEEPTIT